MIVLFAVGGLVLLGIGVWGWWAAPRLVPKELEGEERREREFELRRNALGWLLLAGLGLWFVIDVLTP
jgi:hypothetical protein